MATLSSLLAPDLVQPGTKWTLLNDVNGYGHSMGDSLTTQGRCGRSIRLLQRSGDRLLVQLLEDGYRCWMDLDDLIGRAKQLPDWKPTLLLATEIQRRLPAVLAWSEHAEQQPNHYLWGGTTEPNMDLSLIHI